MDFHEFFETLDLTVAFPQTALHSASKATRKTVLNLPNKTSDFSTKIRPNPNLNLQKKTFQSASPSRRIVAKSAQSTALYPHRTPTTQQVAYQRGRGESIRRHTFDFKSGCGNVGFFEILLNGQTPFRQQIHTHKTIEHRIPDQSGQEYGWFRIQVASQHRIYQAEVGCTTDAGREFEGLREECEFDFTRDGTAGDQSTFGGGLLIYCKRGILALFCRTMLQPIFLWDWWACLVKKTLFSFNVLFQKSG